MTPMFHLHPSKMTYLGTPWIDSRVPYPPVRKILATCGPSGLVFRAGRCRTGSRPQNAPTALLESGLLARHLTCEGG
jgi:hypothetical protein